MAYSLDLRRRVVDSYQDGEGSIREIAERYKVHFNTVMRWVNRKRESGDVQNYHHLSGPQFDLSQDQRRIVLRSILKETPDAILTEITAKFEQITGFPISTSSVRREFFKMGITRKKKRSGRQNAIQKRIED